MNNKILKTSLVASAMMLATTSFASEVETYSEKAFLDKVTTSDFVENAQGEVHRFMVGVEDKELAIALISNDRMRKALELGESFSYKGQEYVKNKYLLQVADNFKYDLKSTYGYDFHVVDMFNDIYVVMVTAPSGENIDDVASNLLRTGNFTYVQEDKQVFPASYEQEDGNGTMSVTNPSLYNDPLYPEQLYHSRQVEGFYGGASIEEAKRIMKERGVFSSGKKVNVHVLDGGKVVHEDVEYAEAVDFKYRNHIARDSSDGVVWIRKNYTADDGQYKTPIFNCNGFASNPESEYATSWRPDEPPAEEADQWFRYDTKEGISLNSVHGLQASGIIGAKSDNGVGISGIIPDENLNLVSALVVDACGGSTSDIIKAVYWSIDNIESPYAIGSTSYDGLDYERTQYPADVINMSFGGLRTMCYRRENSYWTTAWANAIKDADEAGAVLVGSAGNEASSSLTAGPAGCSGVISVGAISSEGGLSVFSNYGKYVDLMALGSAVYSTSGVVYDVDDFDLGYGTTSGTSFSAPIVSGLAGLLKLADDSLTPNQVKDLIVNGAASLDSGVNGKEAVCGMWGCGSGAVNFENSVRMLLDGEILGSPKASHYLANSDKKNDGNFLSLHQEFNGNFCTTYQVSGTIMSDNYDKVEYSLYGEDENGDYQLVKTANNSEFTFDDQYSSYRLSGCNSETGQCSRMVDVELDRTYKPSSCE